MNIRRSLFAFGAVAFTSAACSRFPAGRPTATHAHVGPTTGSLVVVGGGNMGPEIFARFGESGFREGERRVMTRLLDGPVLVLATGGGAFMDPVTRGCIRDRGISVWLRAGLDLLVKRTAGRDHRPLLKQGNPTEILDRLMKQRYPVYAEADITVDSQDEPPEVTVDNVLRALAAFQEAQP